LFRNEKYYNCDLSAACKIGARYWIREILDYSKSLAGNGKVAKRGQMPDLAARHEQTLASLSSPVQYVLLGDFTSFRSAWFFFGGTRRYSCLVVGACHQVSIDNPEIIGIETLTAS
jgi:hypothetical protein